MGIRNFLKKWKDDYIFKTLASTALSFSISILFALYNGFLGIRQSSIWHGSMCVFYLLLVMIRGSILLPEISSGTKSETEKLRCRQKTFKISTSMLLILNLALVFPISLMAVFEKPVHMGTIPSITMAVYTVYKLTMSFVHICKRKHSHHNPLITELRTINFIDALVSILTLQNTLIMVNSGSEQNNNMFLLSAVSSAVIYIAIVFITIQLFVRSHIGSREGVPAKDDGG